MGDLRGGPSRYRGNSWCKPCWVCRRRTESLGGFPKPRRASSSPPGSSKKAQSSVVFTCGLSSMSCPTTFTCLPRWRFRRATVHFASRVCGVISAKRWSAPEGRDSWDRAPGDSAGSARRPPGRSRCQDGSQRCARPEAGSCTFRPGGARSPHYRYATTA